MATDETGPYPTTDEGADPLVPSDAHIYGNPSAPVTIVEYGDFECPYCRAAAPVLRRVVDGSDGEVRLVFRHFPLFEIHPFALTAALAAEAASAQGKFWEMHDQLFAHQERLTDVDLADHAEAIGLDGASVVGEAAQGYASIIERDYVSGIRHGAQGTPTLFLHGVWYRGKISELGLQEAIADGRRADA